MCYQAALAKGQPKFAEDTKSLQDQFGGPMAFDVTKIFEICNPANRTERAYLIRWSTRKATRSDGRRARPSSLRSTVP